MFVGYIVVDTQEIVERAHLGDMDYVKHALTLFTDFAAIFVRILIIVVSSTGKQLSRFLLRFILLNFFFRSPSDYIYNYFAVEEFSREK